MKAVTAPGPVKLTPPPTVLRGPADPDAFRVKVGRFGERWYTDNLPADDTWGDLDDVYPSVTTVKKASGSDWSYVAMARINAEMETGVLDWSRMDADQRYEAMKSANKRGLAAAGQRGTNVHLMAEARLYGLPDPIKDDQPGADYRAAVQAFFHDYQPELVAAEFVCIHRHLNGYGYGGTADALCRIGGKVYLVDWKSRGADSKHAAYPEEGAQVSAYAGADYMLIDRDGTPSRQALPTIDGGLIVSIKPDGYRVYPVDLEAGFAHWASLHAWWCARRDESKVTGRQWPAGKIAAPTPDVSPTSVESPVLPAGDGALTPSPAPTHVEHVAEIARTQGKAAAKAATDTVNSSLEGDIIDDGSFDTLLRHWQQLSEPEQATITRYREEADAAGVPWWPKGARTARRYSILRALILLAKRDECNDRDIRTLLEVVITTFRVDANLGAAIGSLSAQEAHQFARLAAGDITVTYLADGTPTLTASLFDGVA